MSVNDKALTQKMENAVQYFRHLKDEAFKSRTDRVEVTNGEMIEAAGYAASVLEDSNTGNKIMRTLVKERGYPLPDALVLGNSSQLVKGMCGNYAIGKTTTGRYAAEQAERVCTALLDYVKISEK